MALTSSYHELISEYNLQPHPEGGYYRQTYQSALRIPEDSLPEKFGGERFISTAIYFLLPSTHFSAFHRIKSDELWHFYSGDAIRIHVIDPDGNYTVLKLGMDHANGEYFQHVVLADSWFAAETTATTGYGFVGCTVSPGFDFQDFEMARKELLVELFPQHEQIITRLCRG